MQYIFLNVPIFADSDPEMQQKREEVNEISLFFMKREY